jgi:hypothetical protein
MVQVGQSLDHRSFSHGVGKAIRRDFRLLIDVGWERLNEQLDLPLEFIRHRRANQIWLLGNGSNRK